MTFNEIVQEICDRLNLTSPQATARVGRLVNIKYREITSSIGLNTTRRTEVQANASQGSQLLTFSGVEKVISVIDKSGGTNRFLDEVSVEELDRSPIADSDTPTKYALYRTNAATVQIKLNVNAQSAFTLYAAGIVEVSTLSGSQEPAFPESYHDLLVSGVLADEYMKLEKPQLARREEARFDDRMGDLRIFIAKSPQQDIYQGKMAGSSLSGAVPTSGGGGGGTNGATSYTQTGLVTFDRTSAAPGSRQPFAVAAGSEEVPNLIAAQATLATTATTADSATTAGSATTATTATNATQLNGQAASYYTNASNLASGTVPLARISGLTNTQIDAAAAIGWSKVSKAGSSLADLATRSAGDLSSGNLPFAQLPTGGGTWAAGGNLTITGGQVTNASQPRASVYHNATISLANATWTSLSMNSEDFDVGSMHDTVTNNSRITIPTGGDGVYMIVGAGEFTANATGSRYLRIRKNNTTTIGTRVATPNAGAGTAVCPHCLIIAALVAGDYIELQAYQDSGGSLNIGAATRENAVQLAVAKLW